MNHFKQVKAALLCMQRHSWEQGVAMQAMLETGDLPAVILMAHDGGRPGRDHWRQRRRNRSLQRWGRTAGGGPRHRERFPVGRLRTPSALG